MKIHAVTLLMPGRQTKIQAREDQHIWDAAKEQGFELPSICHQGRCLTCAGRLENPTEGDFDNSDATYYFPQDRDAGFILLCTAKASSDLRIHTHQQHEMRKHRLAHGLPAPYS